MSGGVARTKLWDVNIRLPLNWDTKDRIALVLQDGEERTGFIRDAIDREIEKRGGPPPQPREAPKPSRKPSPPSSDR